MDNSYKGIIGLGRAIINKSRLSNAMGIPLVFVVVIFAGGLIGYIITQKDFFFWIMFLPIVFFMLTFIFFMIFKPKMLRTEEHEERMMQIASGMGQKGESIEELSESELELAVPDAVSQPKRLEDEIKK